MGKIFEALKKAEKERVKLIKKAGQDPSALAHGDGEVDPHLVAYFDRMSPITEQYRSLKTNIAALHEENPPKAIVFTSANAGEGKTTTALNLAVTLADDRETRVVVVDADLRRPRVHMMLGLENNKGLADYLTGNVMLELVLQRSRLPNLHVLPAGRLPGNPTELLAGNKMDDLFERLTRDFAHVLVDAPAISRHTDAAVLASKTDGAVLVLKMRETPRKDVLRATDLLQKAQVNLLGTVLTHINPVMKDYYYSTAAV